MRSLYRPIQPTAKLSEEAVSYVEHLPSATLKPFIYCYWQLQTTQKLESPFHYKVVADGCIDIFFELDQPDLSFVMGFCKKYTEFPLAASFNYVGIRFLPSMFTQFFKIPAIELSNRYETLSLVLPEVAHFLEKELSIDFPLNTIAMKLDSYFSTLLAAIEVEDVDALYEEIKRKNVEIAVELRDEPWGDRHFVIVDPNGVGIDLVKYTPPSEEE